MKARRKNGFLFLEPCASLIGVLFSPEVRLWTLPGPDVGLDLGSRVHGAETCAAILDIQ